MAERPRRIQLRRTKGWRMPPNTVKVARPTRWGNPYRIGVECATAAEAVAEFRCDLVSNPLAVAEVRAGLRGKSLACFCPLDQPCHADVLLAVANSGGADGG